MIFSLTIPISPASADWIQYQRSPADTYNRPDLPVEYDITRVDFGVNETDTDEYWFFLMFSKPVTASMFVDSSWAGVFLDVNNDGKEDYRLSTDDDPYEGNYYKPGFFTDVTSGTPLFSSKCTVNTWTDLNKSANYIGFSIKKVCLDLNSTVGVQGYADHITDDNAEFDFSPEKFWTMDLKGGVVTKPGNSSSAPTIGQLPSVNNIGESIVTSPANQPSDLVVLAAQTTKSVVTVLCGDGIGSGWAINANLSSTNSGSGYTSYVITNHHVIADCTLNRDVTLVLSDQTRVSGYVYAWDEANDVAGILTSTKIPPLNWRGATPQQGWWVGIIGSPLGFPGVLTTGIVSSVQTGKFLGTTTAPINPGNSGGPVFDRTGRVIGLATAKYIDAESFGIFHGAPLLCQKIVSCTSTSQIWQGAITATPPPTPTPTPTVTPKPTPTPTADVRDFLRESAVRSVSDAINRVESIVTICYSTAFGNSEELGYFIEDTPFGSKCGSLDAKIEELKASFEGTTILGSDTSDLLLKMKNFNDSLDNYEANLISISDELSSSQDMFADLYDRLTKAEEANFINQDLANAFLAKLKLLPLKLQSTIRAKSTYTKLTQGTGLKRKFDTTLNSQSFAAKSIESKKNLQTVLAGFKLFETRYRDYLFIQDYINELDLLVPDYVCLKGKTSSLVSKSGTCLKGYKKTPTFLEG